MKQRVMVFDLRSRGAREARVSSGPVSPERGPGAIFASVASASRSCGTALMFSGFPSRGTTQLILRPTRQQRERPGHVTHAPFQRAVWRAAGSVVGTRTQRIAAGRYRQSCAVGLQAPVHEGTIRDAEPRLPHEEGWRCRARRRREL